LPRPATCQNRRLKLSTIKGALHTTTEGYLNIKGYKEFAAQDRPDGWNTWVTFTISPAAPTPSAPPRRMITK